jgi:tRNA threonylcarbamoyladenosine biosynthesis protein TsaE
VKESIHFESSEEELYKFCPQILSFIQSNKITLLYGQMGAGKTALIRAICKELDCSGEVSSPTFSLINEYIPTNKNFTIHGIYHMDLYRLNSLEEALNIAIEDHLWSGKYCFIEWPQLILPLLQKGEYQEIFIETLENNQRSYTLKFAL